jgi:peptide/nickel transport system substrate-binding protein
VKYKLLLLALGLLIIFSIIVTSCSQGTTSTTTSAPATTTAPQTTAPQTTAPSPVSTPSTSVSPTSATPSPEKYGGILKIIIGTSPNIGWLPKSAGIGQEVRGCIESLWFYDKDRQLQPWLATSWDIASDWSSVTFHLRKDVKFHDGTVFDANAAKWNLEAYRAAKAPGTEAWGTIDIIDDYNFKLNLAKYQSTQISTLSDIGFVSPTAVQKNGEDWAYYNPVGTGPFKLKNYIRDVSIEYERFDGYYGARPYLDGIKWLLIRDEITQKMSFQAGDAQLLWLLSPNPQLVNEMIKTGAEATFVKVSTNILIPDSANPNSPFSQLKVRQAFEYAIDRPAISQAIGGGIWDPAYQFCPVGFYAYNADITGRKYDTKMAKQLLSEAGYPTGFKTSIIATAGGVYLDALQSYFKNVGIDLSIDIVTGAKNTDLSRNGWSGLETTGRGMWGGQCLENYQQVLAGRDWASLLKAPEFLAIMDQGLSARDQSTKEAKTKELVKWMYDNSMVIPTYYSGGGLVSLKGVHDVQFHGATTKYYWAADKVWMDKDIR